MKTVAMNKTDLNSCVAEAQSQRVVLTRNGAPVALVVGVAGLDKEQIELGASVEFWKLMEARRKEKTVTRRVLEQIIQKKTKRTRS